jgi:tRNA nucleotidyltransferase (CCA-adding enzyme)
VSLTVSDSINKFIENISLTGNQSDIAEKRATSIVNLLSKEFNILEAFPMGSLITQTSLKGHADVDVMVVLHYGEHIKDKTPTDLLQDIRDVLSGYNTKQAKKNGQASTLYFQSWPNVDIVPSSRYVKKSTIINKGEN